MHMHYVVNARLPNPKAYGIQIAKMCEAFAHAGVDVTLVVPRTRMSSSHRFAEFYGLDADIPVVKLPAVDWYDRGRPGFLVSTFVFMFSCSAYLLFLRIMRRIDVIYTIDMDSFSFSLLPLFGVPCVAEMHEAKRPSPYTRLFFKKAALVVATNAEIRSSLSRTFRIAEDRIAVEPNGVDLRDYEELPARSEARARLGVPAEGTVALYAGRFYEWKGLDILADAAALAPDIEWHVIGGDRRAFEQATGVRSVPPNLHIQGDKPHDEVPLWLAAADVLLLIGTGKNERSFRHTSPMKLYEYMAARRPVVASATPALTSIVSREALAWYAPDDASDLARVAREADALPAAKAERAREEARQHTWTARARRILASISGAV